MTRRRCTSATPSQAGSGIVVEVVEGRPGLVVVVDRGGGGRVLLVDVDGPGRVERVLLVLEVDVTVGGRVLLVVVSGGAGSVDDVVVTVVVGSSEVLVVVGASDVDVVVSSRVVVVVGGSISVVVVSSTGWASDGTAGRRMSQARRRTAGRMGPDRYRPQSEGDAGASGQATPSSAVENRSPAAGTVGVAYASSPFTAW